MGKLASDVGILDATFTITAFQSVSPNDIRVGMGAMLGDEIVRVEAVAMPDITVARGCADTVPVAHLAGVNVWFFTESTVTDEVAYTATDTVGVKGLPFTVAAGPVPVSDAPPLSLTFNWRFLRPYPPGKVTLNGKTLDQGPFYLDTGETEILVEWAHRDRVLQGDQLIDHGVDSIGPEPGTEYKVRVLADDKTTVLRSVSGITGTSWSYTQAMIEDDIADGEGFIELSSVRDTISSLQSYLIPITGVSPAPSGGLGRALGMYLGS